MRIITINVNGVRSAAKKGLFSWLARQKADVVCVQETKAQIDQLSDPIFHPKGFHCYYFDAIKKGYSGTAIYAKVKPRKLIRGLGVDWIDNEGRYLEAQFGNLSVVSLYMPSGSSGDVRQAFKFEMMDAYLPHLQKRQSNKKNSGFLPEEREWLTDLFTKHKYADAFRQLPQKEHEYTWWSNRGQSWDKNVGWRLDYQVISDDLSDKVERTKIYRNKRFSDHAPFIVDYDVEIEP